MTGQSLAYVCPQPPRHFWSVVCQPGFFHPHTHDSPHPCLQGSLELDTFVGGRGISTVQSESEGKILSLEEEGGTGDRRLPDPKERG